MNGQSVI
jgi:hypothetical protein